VNFTSRPYRHGHGGAPSAKLAILQQQVLKRCPVYNLIRDSKARIRVAWAIVSEA
jgi:hypothetical protein